MKTEKKMNKPEENSTDVHVDPEEGSPNPFIFAYTALAVFFTLFFIGILLDVFVIYVMVREWTTAKEYFQLSAFSFMF